MDARRALKRSLKQCEFRLRTAQTWREMLEYHILAVDRVIQSLSVIGYISQFWLLQHLLVQPKCRNFACIVRNLWMGCIGFGVLAKKKLYRSTAIIFSFCRLNNLFYSHILFPPRLRCTNEDETIRINWPVVYESEHCPDNPLNRPNAHKGISEKWVNL